MPDPRSHRAGPLVGIEIGGTKLQVVTGDARGAIQQVLHEAVDRAEGAPGIRRNIERMIGKCVRPGEVSGVGVGFGGPLDRVRGEVTRSHQIEGWSGFPLGAWLGELTGAPVFMDNDANVAALAEATAGAGVGWNPVFYVTLGSGVGGGLVVEGRIYHGVPPGESEIGHVRLGRDGELVEGRCSGWAVDARIRREREAHPDSALARLAGTDPGGEARHLPEALASGDGWAARILEDLAGDLGYALSHVVHLMHPGIILLGGGLSGVGEPLRAAVEERLRGHVMGVFRETVRVGLAALRDRAVPTGALILAGQGM